MNVEFDAGKIISFGVMMSTELTQVVECGGSRDTSLYIYRSIYGGGREVGEERWGNKKGNSGFIVF